MGLLFLILATKPNDCKSFPAENDGSNRCKERAVAVVVVKWSVVGGL